MKKSKSPEARKKEIMDVAETLFITKGYAKTTINNILSEIDIAKGTFYYYFKSKEDVMDAIIDRFITIEVEAAEAIAADDTLKAPDKIFRIIMGENHHGNKKEKMIEELHEVSNEKMHQKSLIETIKQLAPILTRMIEQGIVEGVFETPYPRETVEVLLVSSGFIFDDGIFQWDEEEKIQKAKAFVYILETVLKADKGDFQYLLQELGK
ncbi:MAG TPA: TetR/AcrR family transcriptional regulator [Pseudogracilibacillus sp.]|nr:TetR/AcrR family transcriptional regulator [Pseudogracilibacillus sp.]